MLTYQIVHDIPGRMRIRYGRYAFSKNIESSLCSELKNGRWSFKSKSIILRAVFYLFMINKDMMIYSNLLNSYPLMNLHQLYH